MVYFQTKNPNLGNFWRVLQWKMVVYFMSIWSTYYTAIGNILWLFGILCDHLVYFSPFWRVVPRKIWQPCPIPRLDYEITNQGYPLNKSRKESTKRAFW
jgi:hypothetical protein